MLLPPEAPLNLICLFVSFSGFPPLLLIFPPKTLFSVFFVIVPPPAKAGCFPPFVVFRHPKIVPKPLSFVFPPWSSVARSSSSLERFHLFFFFYKFVCVFFGTFLRFFFYSFFPFRGFCRFIFWWGEGIKLFLLLDSGFTLFLVFSREVFLRFSFLMSLFVGVSHLPTLFLLWYRRLVWLFFFPLFPCMFFFQSTLCRLKRFCAAFTLTPLRREILFGYPPLTPPEFFSTVDPPREFFNRGLSDDSFPLSLWMSFLFEVMLASPYDRSSWPDPYGFLF